MAKKKKKNSNKNNSVKKINTVDEDFIDIDVVPKKELDSEKLKELEEFIEDNEEIEEEIIYTEGELDSSFIDGNVSNKKIDTQETVVVFNDDVSLKYKIKMILMFSIILMLIGIASYLYLNPVIKEVEVEKIVVDENIVFLGDSITEYYDLEEYYSDYNVVNSGISGHKSYDVLDNMEDRVYKYNPSKVFLNIGINDLALDDVNTEDVYNNIVDIFEGIKINREVSELYFVSIYPISNIDDDKIDHDMVGSREPELVNEINNMVKEYCEENNVVYIDIYSDMVDEEGMINLEYTTEGLHISDKGYELITEELMKYIEDDEKK